MRAARCRRSAKRKTPPHFFLRRITGYDNPGWLRPVVSQDTDLFCHLPITFFVAPSDHNPPTLLTDRQTETDRRTDGRTDGQTSCL